jgi:hypothetical protein
VDTSNHSALRPKLKNTCNEEPCHVLPTRFIHSVPRQHGSLNAPVISTADLADMLIVAHNAFN